MPHFQFTEWVERGQEAQGRASIAERVNAFPRLSHAELVFAYFRSPEMTRVVGMIDATRRTWRARRAA